MFMFVEVPEPVWKTSIGNWSSCRPRATSDGRIVDGLGDVASATPAAARSQWRSRP